MITLSVSVTKEQYKKLEALKNWRAPFMTVAEYGKFLLLAGVDKCQECPNTLQQPRQEGINLKNLTD